jgi:response regulator RpfG family c-di-GMP phosphodiesterase
MTTEIARSNKSTGKTEDHYGTAAATAVSSVRRVLIVDDDPAILQVTEQALTFSGYQCVKARSAEQALIALNSTQNDFDLMLTDVGMGGMSGIDLMRRALEIMPGLTVIIMSGATEVETPIQAHRAGSADYLTKPFDSDDLLNCVTEVLLKKERADEEKRCALEQAIRETAERAFSLSLDARDKETEGHTERVVAFSRRLGQELGLSESEMVSLELGAHLHDIGKIAVPDHVLKKPHPLTEEEWVKMRLHPGKGQDMVQRMNLPEGAALVVGQHHERWDGAGYPKGLSGKDIYIGARVFSVIDTFDAITSHRCYRRGRPYEVALAEIVQHSGSQFDPAVVEAFKKIDPADWDEIRSKCPEDVILGENIIAC